MVLTKQDIDRLIPYWRPEPEKEYNHVCLGNWHVKTDNFGKDVLAFDVLIVDNELYRPAKEFTTGSSSLIRQLWPIIEGAQARGDAEIFISLKQTGKKYLVFDISQNLKRAILSHRVNLHETQAPIPEQSVR